MSLPLSLNIVLVFTHSVHLFFLIKGLRVLRLQGSDMGIYFQGRYVFVNIGLQKGRPEGGTELMNKQYGHKGGKHTHIYMWMIPLLTL